MNFVHAGRLLQELKLALYLKVTAVFYFSCTNIEFVHGSWTWRIRNFFSQFGWLLLFCSVCEYIRVLFCQCLMFQNNLGMSTTPVMKRWIDMNSGYISNSSTVRIIFCAYYIYLVSRLIVINWQKFGLYQHGKQLVKFDMFSEVSVTVR